MAPSRPFRPPTAASTSTEDGRQRKTTSLARATSAGFAGLLRAAGDEVVDRLAIAVAEDGERIAALLEDVLGDAVPHQPDTDESDPGFLRPFRELPR